MGKYFKNKRFIVFVISVFIIVILFSVNLNKINEESTTEELINFLKQDIGNINKHKQVDKAIDILNNRDVIDKMQVYFDIITLDNNNINKTDYKNINKLVQLTLNKDSYNEEEYTVMINKYSDTYYITQDGLLKDTIIACFNEIGETFYPNNEYTFIEKMFGMDIDFDEEEEYMASKFLDGIISLEDTSIDKMIIHSLLTKFYNNSSPNEQIDYHRFYSVVQKHYDNKFGKDNSIGNIIEINNQQAEYFNRLKSITDGIDRLKSNSGYKSTEGSSDYIQKEYEKAINDSSVMAEAIDRFHTEEEAKLAIMKAAIVSAHANGYYEYINNDEEIENKTIEFNNIMNELELLNDKLFKETENILELIGSDLAEKTNEQKKNEKNTQHNLPLTKTVTNTVEIYTNEYNLELFVSKLGYYLYYEGDNLNINEFEEYDEYSLSYLNSDIGFSIFLMKDNIEAVQNWLFVNLPKTFSNVSEPMLVESPLKGILIETYDDDGFWETRHYLIKGNGKVFYIKVIMDSGLEGLSDIFDMYLKEFNIL